MRERIPRAHRRHWQDLVLTSRTRAGPWVARPSAASLCYTTVADTVFIGVCGTICTRTHLTELDLVIVHHARLTEEEEIWFSKEEEQYVDDTAHAEDDDDCDGRASRDGALPVFVFLKETDPSDNAEWEDEYRVAEWVSGLAVSEYCNCTIR
jgi:hypothetical protein